VLLVIAVLFLTAETAVGAEFFYKSEIFSALGRARLRGKIKPTTPEKGTIDNREVSSQ
jgi:hypothetical protein